MEEIIKRIFGEKYTIKLYNDACYFEFNHNQNIAAIGIGFIVYPGTLRIDGISVKKRFNEVESVLQPILDKFKINLGFWKSTIFNDYKVDFEEFNVNNTEEIEKTFTKLHSMFPQFEKEFLDSYISIKQVYDKSEQMEIKELVDFINQPLPLRRMVIKRICNDKYFNGYCENVIEKIKIYAKEKPVQYRNQDKAAIELYQVLKSL